MVPQNADAAGAMLIPVITYTAPDGEMRYGNHPPPKCADMAEVERACRPALQALRGAADVRVDVMNDLTGACVMLFRIR